MHDLENRVFCALQGTLKFLCFSAIERASKICESPIEILLVSTLDVASDLIDPEIYVVTRNLNFTQNILFVPQYEWRNKRIDLAALRRDGDSMVPILFVECDGHDFHERTKEQAERDRSRDREIQQAGIKVFRFTGREIHRDVLACVDQIFAAIRPSEEL